MRACVRACVRVRIQNQVFDLPDTRGIYAYRSLREYFAETLEKVAERLTPQRALILLLDGLDHFRTPATAAAAAAQSLSWLPESWPRHVHVVLTTDAADALTLRNLRNHVRRIVRRLELDSSVVDQCFFEVAPLTVEELDCIVDMELAHSSRTLTSPQRLVCVCVCVCVCVFSMFWYSLVRSGFVPYSASTLSVGWAQEGHPACKKRVLVC